MIFFDFNLYLRRKYIINFNIYIGFNCKIIKLIQDLGYDLARRDSFFSTMNFREW